MTVYKKMAAAMFAAIAVLGMAAGSVSAQTDAVDIRAQIADLKEEHKEMRAQVEAGDLTKEEAMELWSDKVTEIRTLKDQLFDGRVEKLNERYETLAEKNPERAAALQDFIGEMKDRREAVKAEREALQAAIQAGEITREEAHAQRKALHQEARREREEMRGEFKVKKAEFKAENAEKREEMKAQHDEIRAAVESGDMTREEAREALPGKRPLR